MQYDEIDVAVCSAVEAVFALGDDAFETQVAPESVVVGSVPMREDSTFGDIQPAQARKLKLPTARKAGSSSTRISPTWTREERDCYQFLIATPYMWS